MTKHSVLMFVLAACVPPAVLATSAGGPIGHSAVPSESPIDNNVQPAQTCQRCHNSFPLNSPGGSVRIEAFHYRPGQKQTIKVTVSHPEAVKWGFQLTARQTSDLTKRAGTFSLGAVRVRCSDVATGRDVTAETPCPSDALEFAGHNQNINTGGGSNGAKTFEVEWTAPAMDVGNVIFYAVGNATNGGGTNQGDRIYSDNLEIEGEGRPCSNTAKPSWQSMVNAASGTRDVSMNTIVSIFGRDFAASGTKRGIGRADLRTGFPKELSCVAVEIGGVRVPLTYVSFDQINAQLPTVATTGSLPVRVITNPGRPNELQSDAGSVTLQTVSPSFFTFLTNGKNIAAVHQDGTLATAPSVVAGARVVKAGDIVQLFATGLGATNPVWQAGEMPDRASPLLAMPTVTVGGTALAAADVLYAGLVPGSISGLYQINIRIPATIAEGDVPVTITAGGLTSPAGTVLTAGR